MRIQPVVNTYNTFNKTSRHQTQFEAKNSDNDCTPKRNYTGIVSADLAYASMVNPAIAKDLAKMGLI